MLRFGPICSAAPPTPPQILQRQGDLLHPAARLIPQILKQLWGEPRNARNRRESSKSAPAASKSWPSCTMRPQLGLDTFKPFINLNPNGWSAPHLLRRTPDSSSNPSETRGFASFRCQANSSIPQTTMGRASKCSKSSKSAPAASKSWASCTMRPQLVLDTFKPFINLNPNDCFGPA